MNSAATYRANIDTAAPEIFRQRWPKDLNVSIRVACGHEESVLVKKRDIRLRKWKGVLREAGLKLCTACAKEKWDAEAPLREEYAREEAILRTYRAETMELALAENLSLYDSVELVAGDLRLRAETYKRLMAWERDRQAAKIYRRYPGPRVTSIPAVRTEYALLEGRLENELEQLKRRSNS
jgi:hypothetical protein